MAGPEIIGYETDPNATEMQRAVCRRFEIGTDEHGFYYKQMKPPYRKFYPQGHNRKSMRLIGMRPVYRERDCKATLSNNFEGCSLWCRKCGYRWYTVRLPHDSAGRHWKVCYAA